MTSEKLTLSIGECAELAGIGRSLAYSLAREGRLPGVLRLGRRLLVSRSVFVAYLNGDGGEGLPPPPPPESNREDPHG